MAATQHLCQTRRLLMRRALHFHPEYISIQYEDTVSFCFQPSTTTALGKNSFFLISVFIYFFRYSSLDVFFSDNCSDSVRYTSTCSMFTVDCSTMVTIRSKLPCGSVHLVKNMPRYFLTLSNQCAGNKNPTTDYDSGYM